MEFALEYHGHIHRDFNVMGFPEFVSLYDKLLNQKRREENEKANDKSLSITDMVNKMNTGREE